MPTRARRLAALAREQPLTQAKAILAETPVPLLVEPSTLEALRLSQERLRCDAQLYHDVALVLRRAQRGTHGPLTDLLAALVGFEKESKDINATRGETTGSGAQAGRAESA